jgi:hypothetical protein
LQQFIVDPSVNSRSIVECQGRIESEALEVSDGVDVFLSISAIFEKFFDGNVGFEVDDWHVTLHSWSVKSSSRCLSALLAGLIPW